ncbi:MAG: transglutaminase family protein [Amphiplicatus sp.]
MRLSVRHLSTYLYDPPAMRVAMRLKLYPSQFDGQSVIDWRVTANGEPVEAIITSGYGDREGLWLNHNNTAQIEIVAEGLVEIEDRSGVVANLPANPPVGVFLRDTPLTKECEAIRDLAAASARGDALEELHEISRQVRAAVDYQTGATDAQTTASQSLRLGAGVCQDHAHIFIAAARSRGHPARYISGYMFAAEGAELHETHAWTEAFVKGLGWVGFDPSNEVCPTERYIRLACGHDAVGAAPVRGNVLGGGHENLAASVVIAQAQQ